MHIPTQLICIRVPREAHEHSGLHLFCIKPGSPITQTPLHPLSLLRDHLRTTAFPTGLSFFGIHGLYIVICFLGRCDDASIIIWYRLALSIKKQSLIFKGLFSFESLESLAVLESAAAECHPESATRSTRKRSRWCKRPSARPSRRTSWQLLWG